MNQICCSGCRLRFTGAAAAQLVACPRCGEPPHPIPSAEAIGFRQFTHEEFPFMAPEAIAVAMPPPTLDHA